MSTGQGRAGDRDRTGGGQGGFLSHLSPDESGSLGSCSQPAAGKDLGKIPVLMPVLPGQVDTIRCPFEGCLGQGWGSATPSCPQPFQPLSLPASVWDLFLPGKPWPRS